MSFENGQKAGKDRIPDAIQKRIETNLPLGPQQALLVKGLEEMQDDLLLDPSDRTGRLGGDFRESYDMLSDDDDDDDDDMPTTTTASSSQAKEDTKKSKKRKKAEEFDAGSEESSKATKAKKKK